jgi:hypothetical protein
MRFQKSEPIVPFPTLFCDESPMGPLQKLIKPSPARQAHAQKYTKKLLACRALADMARTGRYEEEAHHKAGVGAKRPPCAVKAYPEAQMLPI